MKEAELGLEDTFQFGCKMCGNCCRRRNSPVIVSGADIYRIAKAQHISMAQVIKANMRGYIGEHSHLPIMTLDERLDGSCRFLRHGRCIIQDYKPVACALYPLGRFYDSGEKKFHYYMNSAPCQAGNSDLKEWKLQEWIDKFSLKETEDMSRAWGNLITGIASVTAKMQEKQIPEKLLDILLGALYFEYDPQLSYVEQVKNHMEDLEIIFKKEFHKHITFPK